MDLSVIGAGYVGLATSAILADLDHHVICADTDAHKIEHLAVGNCAIHEPTLPEMLRCNLAAGRLIFTTDTPAAVRSSEVVFIAVGTPLDSNGRPDLRQLRAAAPPRQQRQTAAAPH